MLTKILVVIALFNSMAFCMEEDNESSEIIRKPSESRLEANHPSWTVMGLVTSAFSRILGTAQETTENAHKATEKVLATTVEMRSASSQLSAVTNQLHESGALLSTIEQLRRELETSRINLLMANAGKLNAEQSLQRLLSRATPAEATQTANEERDSRIRILEENMNRLSAQVSHIAVERSELETTLQTFKRSLAEIVDPEETDIPSLLTKTAQKMESLSQQQKESAEMYSAAIRELQKQLEEKEQLRLSFSGTIEKFKLDIQALQGATRRFEGNGYTALFDMATRVSKQSSKAEIEKAEQEIIAHITYARLLAPSTPFRNLMELEGQPMWIQRLLEFCLFNDIAENNSENKDRFFTHTLSYLLINGSKLVRYGGTPIDYDKPNLDNSLYKGGLLKAK